MALHKRGSMKIEHLKHSVYRITVFPVKQDDALHITIASEGIPIDITTIREMEPLLPDFHKIYKENYRKPPIEQYHKIVDASMDDNEKLLILIIK